MIYRISLYSFLPFQNQKKNSFPRNNSPVQWPFDRTKAFPWIFLLEFLFESFYKYYGRCDDKYGLYRLTNNNKPGTLMVQSTYSLLYHTFPAILWNIYYCKSNENTSPAWRLSIIHGPTSSGVLRQASSWTLSIGIENILLKSVTHPLHARHTGRRQFWWSARHWMAYGIALSVKKSAHFDLILKVKNLNTLTFILRITLIEKLDRSEYHLRSHSKCNLICPKGYTLIYCCA